MYLHITDDQSGETLDLRKLRGSDIADCDALAEQYANSIDCEIDGDGFVPDGCGNITVTLRDTVKPSARVWNSKSYFLRGIN